MWKRIARGSLVGVFLGTVFGFAIIVGVYIKTITRTKIDSVNNLDNQLAINSDMLLGYEETAGATDVSDIAFRFHVRGNSNSEEDLELKYKVRDAVLLYLSQGLEECESLEAAEQYVSDKIDQIQLVAVNTVRNEGYDYNVRAYMAYDTFPIRQYGELVLPAGTYRALRIDIGEAKGENFWCLLYPAMCHVIDEGAVVSKNDEEIICREMTYDEYKKLFIKHDTGDNEVKVRFKFLEWLPF